MQQRKIKLLPEHIIDQIKAGEVIERPSALLKELLENSIDAGATEIEIHLIDNGLELISISDNGSGISFDDLPYAFCRHATSKIDTFEDLYHLSSFGFRGEALASAASIAKISCITKTGDGETSEYRIEGGAQKLHIKSAKDSIGTVIKVRNLFFNTPVRLKFIKSKTSEKSSLKKVINSFLLAHSSIKFSVQWDSQDKDIFIPKTREERCQQILAKNKNDLIVCIHGKYEECIFSLYQVPKGDSSLKSQYSFINNRFFYEANINRTINRLLEPNVGPFALFIELPPNDIDVNIHPNKTQIKFQSPSLVFSLIEGSIKNQLRQEEQNLKKTSVDAPLIRNTFDNSANYFQKHNFENDAGQSNQRQQEQKNVFLTKRFFIYSNENSKLIIDGMKLYTSTITAKWKAMIPFKEESLMPLLISIPLRNIDKKIDSFFPFLKTIGFELDRLDDNTIVIRSYPFLLPDRYVESVALEFCNNLLRGNSGTLFDHLNLLPDQMFFLGSSGTLDIDSLLSQKIAMPLSDDLLAQLFSERVNDE